MAAAPAIELEVDYLVYKDSSGAEVIQSVREMAAPTGGIQAFAMPMAPDGWLICDGSNNLLISDFPALYDALSVDLNCTVGNGSTVVTINDAIGTTNLAIGMGVRGVGIPPNAEIVQINTASTFTMNTQANANNTAPVKMMFWGQGVNISTFKIPDMRGEFLRGWDAGRGTVDSSRKFSSWQDHMVGPHTHDVYGTNGYYDNGHNYAGGGRRYGWLGWHYDTSNPHTGTNSGPENRPRNLAILYCIKF